MACVGRFIRCEIQSKFLNRPLFFAAVDESIKRISFSIAYFSSNKFRDLSGANDRLQMCPQKSRWSGKRKIYAFWEHVTDKRDRQRKCGGAILRTLYIVRLLHVDSGFKKVIIVMMFRTELIVIVTRSLKGLWGPIFWWGFFNKWQISRFIHFFSIL